MAGSPSGYQNRRQSRVQHDGEHLHDHGRLHDARAAQRGTHRDQRELQREARQEPVQIVHPGAHRRAVRGQRIHIRHCRCVSKDQHDERAGCGERQTLIEHRIRVRPILASHRMRDERDRAHAEHLRQREHDEHEVARRAHAGERRIAQVGDKIEVDQNIQRLKEHARRDRHRHLQDVLADRLLRQILHRDVLAADQALRSDAASRASASMPAQSPPASMARGATQEPPTTAITGASPAISRIYTGGSPQRQVAAEGEYSALAWACRIVPYREDLLRQAPSANLCPGLQGTIQR